MHMMLFFYFKLDLNSCSKKIYSFICYYKKEKQNCLKIFFIQSILSFFANWLSKNCINGHKS